MKTVAVILAMVFSFTSVGAFAAPAVYIRSDGQFVANGNEYPRGFWVPAIEGADQVFDSPEALSEYRQHVEDAKWFGILNWGAVGLLLTYSVIAASNDSFDGGVAFGVFVVPWIAGVIMGTKSNRHLIKAINLVNGVPSTQARNFNLPSAPEFSFSKEKKLNITLASWSF